MTRARITVTIKDDLLQQVDRLVDGLTIRSRSQAIEYLLSKFLSDYRVRKAFVLAGGRKRDIMLQGKPKFLAEIKGRTLLQRMMDSVNEYHVNSFLLYVDTASEQIIDSVQKSKSPYSVSFVVGKKPSGTVQPLLMAKSQLQDTFLVTYGDTITNLNLNDMLSFHRKSGSIATIALTTVSNPREYGVAMLQGNKITEFVQKPKQEVHSYLINAGIFLFEPEIFKYIGRGMGNLEKDLFPKLAERGLLYGYPFQGLYLNVNTRQGLEKARVLL